MKKLRNQKGFTLIELLVVIAIIGILAAVGVPAFQGFQAKAKFNASKENFTNFRNYVMAEISKCNGQGTGTTITYTGTSVLSLACPTSAQPIATVITYFAGVATQGYKNPYSSSQTAYTATAITSGSATNQGQISIVDNSATTAGTFKLTGSFGLDTGVTPSVYAKQDEIVNIAE